MQSRNSRLPRTVKVPGGTTEPERLGNQQPGSLFVSAASADNSGPAQQRGAPAGPGPAPATPSNGIPPPTASETESPQSDAAAGGAPAGGAPAGGAPAGGARVDDKYGRDALAT